MGPWGRRRSSGPQGRGRRWPWGTGWYTGQLARGANVGTRLTVIRAVLPPGWTQTPCLAAAPVPGKRVMRNKQGRDGGNMVVKWREVPCRGGWREANTWGQQGVEESVGSKRSE